MTGLKAALTLALACIACGAARAEISDNVVRIGVLNDISGAFQDTNGMGSVEAARMAAEDFNGLRNINVPYHYYKLVSTAPIDQALRPMSEGGRPMIK
jgi:branched-chain amino acid transport system substrate-binding protein